jgi:hypothetical protein
MNKYKLFNLILSSIIIFSMAAVNTGQVIAKTTDIPVQSGSAMPINPTDKTKVPHYFGPYPNWALSNLTQPNVAISILGDGSGATAIAYVGADGAVTSITITNPGSGYTSATVDITGGGTGATADAVVSSSGVVTGIVVDQQGGGYITPTVTISGGGATTNATATAYGSVDALVLDNPGSGYTMPTVDFDIPSDPNGMQAKAHANFDPVSGAITGIIIDNPGSGYTIAPNVVIRDGNVFNPLINRQQERARAAREQMLSAGTTSPNDLTAIIDATAHATINIQEIKLVVCQT